MTMTARELAEAMLEWGELREKLDALEQAITAEVLKLEKTQTVGNVRASFSGGRTTYDYQGAVKSIGLARSELADYEKVTYDWKTAYEELGMEYNLALSIKSTSSPSVTVKFMG